MHNAAAHIHPLIGVATADHDDVNGHAQLSKRSAQSNRLPRLVIDVGLDNEEVNVAAKIGLPSGLGTEEDHFGTGRGFGKATSCLCDEGAINGLHQLDRSPPEDTGSQERPQPYRRLWPNGHCRSAGGHQQYEP